jgi:hypothetical protein|tara:strand:+ start:148 stop:360 length:213 start_codon:yes stop_codon:yes gene_type:complete
MCRWGRLGYHGDRGPGSDDGRTGYDFRSDDHYGCTGYDFRSDDHYGCTGDHRRTAHHSRAHHHDRATVDR